MKNPLYAPDFLAAIFSGKQSGRNLSLWGDHRSSPISKNAMTA
jgi:hypothetical protein